MFLGVLAQSQTNPAPQSETVSSAAPLSLPALVNEALERNPELQFYKAEIAAAKAGRNTAGVLANPEFSGSFGNKTARASGVETEGIAWAVSIVQPFEWPGRIGLRKAIANRDVELAELGFERFKLALAGRIRARAFNLFAAEAKARSANEVADRFNDLLDVLVQRDPAGLTPMLETRVIEAMALKARRKATDARISANSARFELNQLRGLPLDSKIVVAPPKVEFAQPPEMDRLQELARRNNFDLRVRTAELEQQGFRVDLAKNERFPAISIGPNFSEERAGDRERIVGFSISLPLPFWNRNPGNIQANEARQLQAEIALNVAGREIERNVSEAAMIYRTKLEELSLSRTNAVQHFREAAELADRHYRLGTVPVSTYVELQEQYFEAVEGLLDTKQELLEAALNLELLTGLTPSLIRIEEKGE